MSKTRLKPSASLLRPNASLQRRILMLLADQDGFTLRNLTACLHRDSLDGRVDQRYQWYQTVCKIGEGSASMQAQSRHRALCQDRLLRSLSGKVKRALDKLTDRGLVQRDDVHIPLAGTGWPASWYGSYYDLTPLGTDVVNTLRPIQRQGRTAPRQGVGQGGNQLAI